LTGNRIDLKSCGYVPKKDPKRALRLEWEHVVPAEAFGQSFREWRDGSPQCIKKGKPFRGRKCAEKNSEFSRMEADLYNLWPEVGELNGLRSNYSMAQLGGPPGDFGGCKAKIRDRKFEPMDPAKGIVARTYQYMDRAYPGRGIVSDKNRKLYEAWDRMYPVTDWECKRARKIREVQGNENPILADRCRVAATPQGKL
jgi:deoxyribonuclease-1